MSVSPFTTYTSGQILTASSLNSSFSQVFDNGEDLGWPATKAKDFNGQVLQLDANADTSMYSTTDDQVDWNVGGVNLFTFDGTTASSVNGLTWVTGATGSVPQIQARGSDTHIGLNLVPKGTGTIQISGNATAGYEDANSLIVNEVFS